MKSLLYQVGLSVSFSGMFLLGFFECTKAKGGGRRETFVLRYNTDICHL